MAQPMQQGQDDNNPLLAQQPAGGRTIFAWAKEKMHWWNTPFKNQYTLGALFRYITFREQEEERPSKLGRITERASFAILGLMALALTPGGIAPIVMLGAAKLAAAFLGSIIQPVGHAVEGFFSYLDKKTSSKKEEGLSKRQNSDRVGATNGKNQLSKGVPPGFKKTPENEEPVGTRNGQEEPVGARSSVKQVAPLKPVFDDRAVNTKAKTFSVAGPRPLENYGITPPGQKR